MYIYIPLCRYWIALYRYVLVFIVSHVDIELEDNKQFISNILSYSPDLIMSNTLVFLNEFGLVSISLSLWVSRTREMQKIILISDNK